MALRWLLHSACHVLGYPIDNTEKQCNQIQGCPMNGKVKSLKGLSQQNIDGFQMPLHYPRYTKKDYEMMEEWKLDLLLNQYGLSFKGNLDEKRVYAMGSFLWPDQY